MTNMTGVKRPNDKQLMLFSGRAYPALADEIAALMGVELVPTRALNYANSEIYVRFEESVRGSDAFVIQSHAAPVNEWVMEQLIMVDALKRASAKRITVVAPFYPYARQDKKHRGREPISARLIADLFRTAGANRLMSVDLHAAQIQGFFDGPVDHLWALPVLADYLVAKYETAEMTVVSPDAGRVRLADMWTDRLNCRLAIIHKRRDPDVANEVAVHEVVGEVEGRVCLLVDDMIDTAGTICQAAEALMARGAKVGHRGRDARRCCPVRRVERLQESAFEEVDRHQHPAHPARAALRGSDRALHRSADRPRHQGGLRGRLGHEPLRRAVVTDLPTPATRHSSALSAACRRRCDGSRGWRGHPESLLDCGGCLGEGRGRPLSTRSKRLLDARRRSRPSPDIVIEIEEFVRARGKAHR